MSEKLIMLVGLIYGFISIKQGLKGDLGSMIVFGGYAVSNVGLLMMIK